MTVQRILRVKPQGTAHVAPDATIAELIQNPEFEKEGAVVVSGDGNSIEGIISAHDIVRGLKSSGTSLLTKSVRELMTTRVPTCTPNDRVAGIMALMIFKGLQHMPVLNAGKLVGLVSASDLLRLRLEEVQSEAEAMRSYIAGSA